MSTILTALGSIVLLLVSFFLFSVSFNADEPNAFIFFAGIVVMTASFGLPISVLGNSKRSW